MTSNERAAYLKSQLIANVVINSVLNGVIAYFFYQSRESIPLAEIAVDIQITVAIIAFLVSWIAILGVRKKLIAGGTEILAKSVRWVHLKLPTHAAPRALLIMLALMLVYGGLGLTGALTFLSPPGLSNAGYILFKTVYTGGCAAFAAVLAILSVFREYSQ